jgi:alpha-N-acetylglucosamine transferase
MLNDMPPIKKGWSNFSLCFFMFLVFVNVYVVTEKLILRDDKSGTIRHTFRNCTSDMECEGYGKQLQCLPRKHDTLKKYAVASILFTAGEDIARYETWAEVLGYSLRSDGHLPCSVDMVLLTSFEVSAQHKKRLEAVGWTVWRVPEIHAPAGTAGQVKHPRYWYTFTKFQIFNMTAYTAVLYMDLDTFVVGKISTVFETFVPDMTQRHVSLGWTYDIPCGEDRFNSGVMLVRPSGALLDDMLRKMHTLSYSKSYGEQGFLNAYFDASNALILPQAFNVDPFVQHTAYWGSVGGDAKIIHFIEGIKPDVVAFLLRCWWRNATGFCNAWYDMETRARVLLDTS